MSISDLLFPKKCLGCGKYGSYICDKCISEAQVAPLVCLECGRKSVDGLTHIKCSKPLGLDGTISVWFYRGVVRRAILALKYKFAKEVAKELAHLADSQIKQKNLVFPINSILTPIPLYWFRGNWRGFNQSQEIGKILAGRIGLGFIPDLLIRKKFTKPQIELKGRQRRQNIKGVFALNSKYQPLAISHQSLILFDDVWTTGATIKEAAKVLKRNGVKTVWSFTLTRS